MENNLLYEVTFQPASAATFTVEAKDREEALKKAQEMLSSMSEEEVMECIKNAIEDSYLEITNIYFVEQQK